jgi:hypothetical protein
MMRRHAVPTHTPHIHTFSEVEREEWVHVIRKHAVNSVIDNGYEIRRDDKDSKLGSGKHIFCACVCVCIYIYIYNILYICMYIYTHEKCEKCIHVCV